MIIKVVELSWELSQSIHRYLETIPEQRMGLGGLGLGPTKILAALFST